MKEFNRITIDLIVWKTIIQTALGRMYGLIGESLQFDLIMSHDHQVVLRVYKLDIDKFITSLMGYVINIGKYYDLENQRELHCGLQVIRYGDYLGLVVNHNID
ncbi:uncharacterized protein RJT21DRAFT_25123 [Scheffersomyces amazonensis]|uniref:uncharacterized protein n=1 Tax=Scheffersomyces amazonensis TaxID=1078765 RepID=UPI00315D4AD5